MSIDLEVVPSKYTDRFMLVTKLDGVEVCREYLNTMTAKRFREVIEEREVELKRFKEQSESYYRANVRLMETVQSLQRTLWFGIDKLPKVEPIEAERDTTETLKLGHHRNQLPFGVPSD